MTGELDLRIRHLATTLEGIRQVNRLITRERSPGLLLRKSLQILVETSGLQSATVLLRDPFGLHVEVAAGDPEQTKRFASLLAESGPPPCVARALDGQPLVVRDCSASCRGCAGQKPDSQGPTAICLPLVSDGRDFGVLHALLRPGGEGDPDEIALLAELASDVAFALRSIELESQVGRTEETLRDVGERSHANATARQRAERALRESAEQYRTEFEHASSGRCLCSPDGSILRINPAFAAMLDHDTEPLLGSALEELVHPDDLGPFRELARRLLAGAQTGVRQELRFRRADGSTLWADASIALYRGADGAPLHLIADARDLTEKKEAEARLRASEERYRRLIESLDDIVYAVDRDGRLSYVSGAIGTMGYRPDEVLGRRFVEFAHPDDREALEQAFAARLAADVGPYEFRVFDGAGKVRVVRSSGRRVLEDGRAVGLAGVLIDLTAQRSTEEQLRAAQKMEAIGRLAGGVAHDFNNILTVINSYAGMAARRLEPTDPNREDLVEIQRAGERAAALTRQLLAFSRRQVLQPVVLDVNALAAGMERMLARLLGEDVRLRVVPAPDAGHIRADAGQVEQVLMNLAVNARDAMPGGGELVIETANVELDDASAGRLPGGRAGSFVRFRVTDSGCGMDAATRERLFEPFFTTKPVGKGTGLGLATVYGIVRQSGGGIRVDSEPGRGTTFDVYFPRVDEATLERTAPAPRDDGPGAGTILFVEDDPAIRTLAGHVLTDEGYRVLLAATGGEALVLAERHRRQIDLVVTDVVMPGLSGKELGARLQPLLHDTPILFMSGYGHDALSDHGVLPPDTLFLRKPFTSETLTAKVREILAQLR